MVRVEARVKAFTQATTCMCYGSARTAEGICDVSSDVAAIQLASVDCFWCPDCAWCRIHRIRHVGLIQCAKCGGSDSLAANRYEFYQMFTMWPKELRADLRAGIKAKYQGNYKLSEQYLRKCVPVPYF